MPTKSFSRTRDAAVPKPVSQLPEAGLAGGDVEALADFLRAAHPFDTAWKAAQVLRVPEKTVRNWLYGLNGPSLANVLRIAAAYGPDALAALYPASVPDFLKSACRDAEIKRLEFERVAIEARLRALQSSTGDAAGTMPLGIKRWIAPALEAICTRLARAGLGFAGFWTRRAEAVKRWGRR